MLCWGWKMSRIDKAKELREQILANRVATQKLVKVEDLSEEELADLISLYDEWKVGLDVKAGDKLSYNGVLYKVIQEHTTQENWRPPDVAALFVKIQPAGVLREIKETMLATEAFAKGEKGTWKGKIYESLIDNNVWNPDAHSAGWKLVEG